MYARESPEPAEYDQYPPEDAPGGDVVVARAGGGERFDRGDRIVTIRIDLPQLSLLEIEFDGTFEVSPHTHDDHVDSFYVLDGAVEFVHGEGTRVAARGEFLAAPVGTRHGFRSANGEPARVLNLHAPETGFVERVRRS